MKEIKGNDQSLSQLLFNKKYVIHYYQREYRWGKKQIKELLEDITDEFFDNYKPDDVRKQVAQYGNYYMGSVIVTRDSERAIIDGQQRLTSLTLLLIYLNHLRKSECPDYTDLSPLIYSEQYGEKTFNINDEARNECMNALYTGEDYTDPGNNNSVTNIIERYHDIESLLDLRIQTKEILPFFLDWIQNHLIFIEITVTSEQDAHKVFVTMNDRGLSLTPTEMLKGYLLSEIIEDSDRAKADELWKQQVNSLLKRNLEEKDADDEFIKTWLRSQYAVTIREGKKGAKPEDFDLIGTEFHKWVRDNTEKIGLSKPQSFTNFIMKEFKFYSDLFIRLKNYSESFDKSYEWMFYNAKLNFTLQNQVILASISSDDPIDIVNKKIRMVSCFINLYVIRRGVNYKDFSYSSIKNAIFNITKEIRNKNVEELAWFLTDSLNAMEFKLEGISELHLNMFTKRFIPYMLAHITYYLECSCDDPNANIVKYLVPSKKNTFDIEHVLADDFDSNRDGFTDENDFQTYRSWFGNLILLPADKNRSIQDQPYGTKLITYAGENILAKTFCEGFYENNPRFKKFIEESGLDYHSLDIFSKAEIIYRQNLYSSTATKIWGIEKIEDLSKQEE
ncbi:hypothetical protein TALC_00823 [Thermoplasmatales archaeon BRNA1]|nr:hypothetical protein TALC_00823 [Thermoplasmatales archaeon BRNA1]